MKGTLHPLSITSGLSQAEARGRAHLDRQTTVHVYSQAPVSPMKDFGLGEEPVETPGWIWTRDRCSCEAMVLTAGPQNL